MKNNLLLYSDSKKPALSKLGFADNDHVAKEKDSEVFYKSKWRFLSLFFVPLGIVLSALIGIGTYLRNLGYLIVGKQLPGSQKEPVTLTEKVQSKPVHKTHEVEQKKITEIVSKRSLPKKSFGDQMHDFIGQSIATEMISMKMEERPTGIAQKELQADVWKQVHASGMVKIDDAKDAGARAPFVSLQGKIEGVIANALEHRKIKGAVGVIHTPTIATPLRKDPKGNITIGLVADEIAKDPERLATITDRAASVRRFMQAGGTLVTAHMDHSRLPEKTQSSITAEQVDIYRNTKQQFGSQLIDKVLTFKDDVFPTEYSGATYIIQGNDGELYSFSIWAYQANDVQEGKAPWGLWFGELSRECVAERFHKINNELLRPQGIDMLQLLAQNVEYQNTKQSVQVLPDMSSRALG